MKTFILGLPEKKERLARMVAHVEERGIRGASVVWGIHAENCFGLMPDETKPGLQTRHCYDIDNPGSGFRIGPKLTGIYLGHYLLWSICNQLPDDHFLLLEDDAILHPDFKERMERAMADVPMNFDVLFLGSCCTKGHATTHVRGEVFDVRYPQCNHAMVISKKAMPVLLETQRKCYAPVDCSLIFHAFPKLQVFTVLPRLADQVDTELSP
jgi:GR25 family glycosyltransferase involved in LPS biosynthesis